MSITGGQALMDVLWIIVGLMIFWIYFIVQGGSSKGAPTYKPHTLRVRFQDGYEAEYLCENFDDALTRLETFHGLASVTLEPTKN